MPTPTPMVLCCLNTLVRQLRLPDDEDSVRCLAIGIAMRFLELRHGARIGDHLDRVIAAVDSGQYRVFFDRYTRPVAFVSWAFVDDRLDRALPALGPSALASAPWQGGRHAWIVDLFAHDGSLADVMAFLRDEIFAAAPAVSYFRFRGGRRLVKQLARTDDTRFARARPRAPVGLGELVDNGPLLHPMIEVLELRTNVARGIRALRASGAADRSALWSDPGRLGILLTLRQVRSYRHEDGSPAGFVAWAWLSARTIARLGQRPLESFHPSEWNEGGTLCIWEMAVTGDARDRALADISRDLFPQESTVLLYAPQQAGRVRRLVRGRDMATLRSWCATVPLADAVPTGMAA